MMQSALRAEQAGACVINSVTTHSFDGADFNIIVLSVLLDKNPDPAKRTQRPAWACVDELVSTPGTIVEALRASLDGAEGVRCLLRDTDSPTGDPTHPLTTRWIQAPMVDKKRVVASIQGLLRALGVDHETASQFLGHSAKRFPLNAAKASGQFSEPELNEIGRFGGSTSQSDDLIPTAAMLQAHSLRCRVLPGIYAGKAKVASALPRSTYWRGSSSSCAPQRTERSMASLRRWSEGGERMGLSAAPPRRPTHYPRAIPPCRSSIPSP